MAKIYIVNEILKLDPESLMEYPDGITVLEFEVRETEKSFLFDIPSAALHYERRIPKDHPRIGRTPEEALERFIRISRQIVSSHYEEIRRRNQLTDTLLRNIGQALELLGEEG